MRSLCILAMCLLTGLGLVSGCFEMLPPEAPDGTGGLSAGDFERISLNGFDPEDNEVDLNDYAWSMEYFQPDGDAPAYLYVGTGNDLIGQIYTGIAASITDENVEEFAIGEPEIRRYREDIFRYAWETVLDYRDIETDPGFEANGFRHLRQYRSQTDGRNHLYAATSGTRAVVWRTTTGDPGSWEVFWQPDEPGSIRYLEELNGLLYLSFDGEVLESDNAVGRIFVTDGAQVAPVVTDGFGNPDNLGVMCLAAFNDALYAGTKNRATGYEVWKLADPAGQTTPTLVVANGGPSPDNETAGTPCVFNGRLYIGSQLNPFSSLTRGKAADIIRINPDDTWETVVGPDSISGYGSGFNHRPNAYVWSMAVHDGWFYAATYDQISPLFNVLENLGRLVKGLGGQAREANVVERVGGAGSDLYKTQDGVVWYMVTLDGLGDVGNYGLRTMESVDAWLYVGTANPFEGLEIWRGRSHD